MSDKKESPPLGETVTSGLSSFKHMTARALAHVNYGIDYMKASLVPITAFEGAERVLSPVQDLKVNVEQSILGVSSSINKSYPFLSSMAKAHQGTLMTQIGLGSGVITHIALRNFVARRFRLFVSVSSLMALNTYAVTELIQFADHHKRYKK